MNKISLAGLIFGLMVLGSLFFIIGFLAAVVTFGNGNAPQTPSWASLNQAAPAHNSMVGKFAGAVGGKLLHDQAIKLESKLGGGALAKAVQKVPPSLQPFAAQAQNQLSLRAQQNIHGLAGGIQQGFKPQRFGNAQEVKRAPLSSFSPSNNSSRPPSPAFAPRPSPLPPPSQAGQVLYPVNPAGGPSGQRSVLRPLLPDPRPSPQGAQRFYPIN